MKIRNFDQKLFAAAVLGSLLLPVFAVGQSAKTAVYTAPKETIDRIRDEGMNRSQVMQTLSYMTDVIGPRLTGSANLQRANEWTAERMKGYGLTDVRLEPWTIPEGWERGFARARVIEPANGREISLASSAWRHSQRASARARRADDRVWQRGDRRPGLAERGRQLRAQANPGPRPRPDPGAGPGRGPGGASPGAPARPSDSHAR